TGPVFAPPEDGPSPRRRRRGLPLVGALAAIAASAGLVWWMTPPGKVARPPTAPLAKVAPPSVTFPKAPGTPDRAQVPRAFDDVQDAYADGGAQGLAQADAYCAAALKTDGRVLDYCLAFDLYAAAVAPEIGRSEAVDSTRLAQARAALPAGADPAARLAA